MARAVQVTYVVMAGGRGERLRPLVRADRPKVCLSPDGRRSLLRATIERLRGTWPQAGWLIVTTAKQARAVRQELPGDLRRALLVEPQIRNTAACITLAAVALAARQPRRIMAVVPADHWVGDVGAFRRSLRTAIRVAAAKETIVTVGVHPTRPDPELGYLRTEGVVWRDGEVRVARLAGFVEKPTRAEAARLLRRGGTYWNSGIFVGAADTFLECVTQWLPDHTRRLVPLAPAIATRAFVRRAPAAYRALSAVSFDHGVMDHLHDGAVVEGRFAWRDLGTLEAWAAMQRSRAVPSVRARPSPAGDR